MLAGCSEIFGVVCLWRYVQNVCFSLAECSKLQFLAESSELDLIHCSKPPPPQYRVLDAGLLYIAIISQIPLVPISLAV